MPIDVAAARLLRARVVFTTGQVARICHVAPRTVSKWFDDGKLKGYRIPGSQDRRVPREHLVRFLRENGMPLGPLACREAVVLAGVSDPWHDAFAAALGAGWDAVRADGLFAAAGLCVERTPDAVVLDCTLGTVACLEAAKSIRRAAPDTLLVAVLADDAPDPGVYDLAVRSSDDPALVAALLLERGAA